MKNAALTALLAPVLERHGLELDQLELVPAGRRTVLRITVDGDGPAGRGPLLDDIAAASNEVSATLDASPEMGDRAYTLEVSSRGVARPLTDEKHFRRNTGRLVTCTLITGDRLTGRIISAADGDVVLQVTPEPTKQNKHPQPVERSLAVADITKAMVQVELNRPAGLGDDPDVGDDQADDEADWVDHDHDHDHDSDDEDEENA